MFSEKVVLSPRLRFAAFVVEFSTTQDDVILTRPPWPSTSRSRSAILLSRLLDTEPALQHLRCEPLHDPRDSSPVNVGEPGPGSASRLQEGDERCRHVGRLRQRLLASLELGVASLLLVSQQLPLMSQLFAVERFHSTKVLAVGLVHGGHHLRLHRRDLLQA